ncbi:hypothetical protein [Lysobacter xanthus]
MTRRLLVLALLASPLVAGGAAPVVVYRCVAADGAVLLQNGVRCPKGMQEVRRVIAAPTAPATLPPLPRPVPALPTAAPMPVVESAADPAPTLRPVPPLYTCLGDDAARYFADSDDGTACAPLETVGLDGRSASPAVACETVRHRCEPVAEADRCTAWRERRRLAEQALLFSPDRVDVARAERDRVDAALAGTDCPG